MEEKHMGKWHYPEIDGKKSGEELKRRVQEAGLTVKDLQHYLHLSCPQPIYRWYRGIAMPSVDHLYAISVLLGLHIEELLVARPEADTEALGMVCWDCVPDRRGLEKRMLWYLKKFSRAA